MPPENLEQGISPLSVALSILTTLIISMLAPIAVEYFKNRLAKDTDDEKEEKTDEEIEHEHEIKAIRLEFQNRILLDKAERLAQKTKRVIWFVRSQDPALDYILADLEAEMASLGFSPDPAKASVTERIYEPQGAPLQVPPIRETPERSLRPPPDNSPS